MTSQYALGQQMSDLAIAPRAIGLTAAIAIAVLVAVFLTGCASARHPSASNAWKIGHNQQLCFAAKEIDGRAVSFSLLRFPWSKDGGTTELAFEDPAFEVPVPGQTPVVLAFDSGTIEGYSISKAPEGHFSVRMTTYLLNSILSVMSKASSLKVTVGARSTSFDLAGFGEAIPAVRDCAEKQM